MEDQRQIIEIKKVSNKMTTYYKCGFPTCEAKTANEFCRHHSVHYNQCHYEGCLKRCRKDFCSWHNPLGMEKKRELSKAKRQQVKRAKQQAKNLTE